MGVEGHDRPPGFIDARDQDRALTPSVGNVT
jgi:hypothetical protein